MNTELDFQQQIASLKHDLFKIMLEKYCETCDIEERHELEAIIESLEQAASGYEDGSNDYKVSVYTNYASYAKSLANQDENAIALTLEVIENIIPNYLSLPQAQERFKEAEEDLGLTSTKHAFGKP